MADNESGVVIALNRIEKAFEEGLSRIEGEISNLKSEVKALSESSIRQDERLRVAQEKLVQVKNLEEKVENLEKEKSKLIGMGMGAGGASGAIFAYLMKYITG